MKTGAAQFSAVS